MDSSPHLTRRHLVLGAGAGAGAVILTACSGGSAGGSGYGAGAGASSGSASGAGSAGSGTASAGGGAVLAALADIPVGTGVVTKDAAGARIVVARPTAGTAAAFSAICTHMGCTVTAAGKQLDCPCHGSQYNAATGAVLRGPAPKPLRAVAVHVVDGKVVSGAA